MVKVSLALVGVLFLVFAGCLARTPPSGSDAGGFLGTRPALELGGERFQGGAPALWASDATVGSEASHPRGDVGFAQCLMDACPDPAVECTPDNCERRSLTLDVPEGWWATHEGFLEFSVRWPTVFDDWFQIRIEDSQGRAVAVGRAGYMGPFGLAARLDQPPAGTYTAVLVHVSGSIAYEGVLQLESRDKVDGLRDLLPDLVTLPPTDLSFEEPIVEGPGYFMIVPGELVAPAHQAIGSKGCATEEAVAQSARKCLRFSNAVGNVGEGDLEIRLPLTEGATSLAGGQFIQRVHRSDGTFTERPGGGAEFHAMHAHWHNAAANRFVVYGYDVSTMTKGDIINEGKKAGVCFADIGLVDLGLPYTTPGRFSGAPCLNPALSNDWYMGLSPNWYDNYYWALVDQYVEMTGAPDGAYALCSTTNHDRTLLEADYSNNEACTIFELEGYSVTLLSPAPYHAEP